MDWTTGGKIQTRKPQRRDKLVPHKPRKKWEKIKVEPEDRLNTIKENRDWKEASRAGNEVRKAELKKEREAKIKKVTMAMKWGQIVTRYQEEQEEEREPEKKGWGTTVKEIAEAIMNTVKAQLGGHKNKAENRREGKGYKQNSTKKQQDAR